MERSVPLRYFLVGWLSTCVIQGSLWMEVWPGCVVTTVCGAQTIQHVLVSGPTPRWCGVVCVCVCVCVCLTGSVYKMLSWHNTNTHTHTHTHTANNGTVTCPILLQSSLQNGMIELSTTTVGSTASYSCFLGYQLDRPPTRQCQSDGTWTGNDPVCNREWWLTCTSALVLPTE